MDYERGAYGQQHPPAPGPAPSASRGSVPNYYGAPSTSRRMLTRQHRSMDTVGPLEAIEGDVYGGTGLGMSSLDGPLAINTQLPGAGGGGGGGVDDLPYRHHLSNPISTNHRFWDNASLHQPTMSGMPPGMSLAGEFDLLKREYQANIDKLNQTMNSIKTFWSPELKRERQMRREEANKIAQLERMLQYRGGTTGMPSNDNSQYRMELMAKDEKIRQLTSMLQEMPLGQASSNPQNERRIREMENTIYRLQEMLKATDAEMLNQMDGSSRTNLDSALRSLHEKQMRIADLETEVNRLRSSSARAIPPRDFTDKSVSNHEINTLRMKMEKSELELAERKSELAASQIRMRTAEERSADAQQHLQLLKEQLTNREQQSSLLQGDVEALRQKLEAKNQQLVQRDTRIERLEADIANSKSELADRGEQMRQIEMRTNQLVSRAEALETTVRDKDRELDTAKIRLLSHPDTIREKEQNEKIETMEREMIRFREHIDQLRINSEKERKEQQDSYQAELRQQTATIENLQKELADRDVLLESQNEKIGDLSKEVSAARERLRAAMVDKGAEELRKEVESARNEVDKLLKMVRQLEKENAGLSTQCKQLQLAAERGMDINTAMSTIDRSARTAAGTVMTNGQVNLTKRIEELEEALRESVSITAEREIHLAQQKQLLQQVNMQLSDARRETSELRKKISEGGTGGLDREAFMRSMEAERRRHLEQLLQYKQEALLAAIAEKDAHLAVLEKSRGNRDEIDTVRRHKDGLMRKLQQENERRALVMRPESSASVVPANATIGVGAPIASVAHPSPAKLPDMVTSADFDDSEGVWA